MTPDKFLTDLAALTGCFAVDLEYDAKKQKHERFEVWLYQNNEATPLTLVSGTGPTVEVAMQEARAQLAAHYA